MADFEIGLESFLKDFVFIEGGEFLMGSLEIDNADPHLVKVDSFYIQAAPVQQGLWNRLMSSNPEQAHLQPEWPVTNVDWNDCQRFIERIREVTGDSFRLPTEAEWEFAAAGGRLGRSCAYAGSDLWEEVGWLSQNSGGQPQPVKAKKPNELGLYDMTGNVWEWCQDWYGDYPIGSNCADNPKGPSDGTARVIRGSSFDCEEQDSNLRTRSYAHPELRHYCIGFRLVKSI
jgi:sulfatase modifying factor 1